MRNYVKKYMNDFNKPSVQKDKKKESKLGYTKHKKNIALREGY